MSSSSKVSVLRPVFVLVLLLAGILVLFSMYYRFHPTPVCLPYPKQAEKYIQKAMVTPQMNSTAATKRPLLLLWFWPEGRKFDLKDCQNLLNIDHCELTADRSKYSTARAVLIFHNDIKDDLSNLPGTPRPKFQRWIWLNMDPPPNTRKIPGIESLFNLTSSYRKDADIPVRWQLTVKKIPDPVFVPPNKERLVCWIVQQSDLDTKTGDSYTYYRELSKYLRVEIVEPSDKRVKGDNYFQVVGSCKFFLSFEESVERDYITERLNGPLAAGTVPVALGPSRKNYEKFVPGSSFIHVNDFADASSLAEYLMKLDEDDEAYRKYFIWRQFYTARRHFTDENRKFALAVCQACRHISYTNEYRVVRDLYKWVSQ